MSNIFSFFQEAFLKVAIATLLVIQSVFPSSGVPVGASIPVPVALFETSLQASIASSDTSMTLVSTSTKEGTLTNGTVYGFVIDEGTASEEFVLGTASSSNIVSMSRGVSVVTGNTEVAALQKAHRRGASVKITTAPVLLVIARILNGDETVPNLLKYNATTTPTLDTHIIHKYYADNLVISGAPVATEDVAGIGILATQNELLAGTATSTYGVSAYSLVPQNKFFNATSSATTTVPVTKSGGKLSQGFLDLTEAFTLSGGVTSTGALVQTATVTMSGVNTLSGTTTISSPLTVSASSSFTATATFSNNVAFATSGTIYTNAVLWQYLGSTATTTAADAPAGAKAAIVTGYGKLQNCAIDPHFKTEFIIFSTGKTSGAERGTCTSGGTTAYYLDISASWSGSTVTLTYASDDTISTKIGIIYWYK